MEKHPFVQSILFDEKQIKAKVKVLASIINQHYYQIEKPLILVGILRGCINFLNDLMRHLTIPCAIDFMYVESYSGNLTANKPKIKMDVFNDIYDRDVLIVEDIIDSGRTLIKIVEHLKNKQPKSIAIITLLDKKSKREVAIEPNWSGFIVPDHFLIGYGLDYQEILRNLPYVATANISEIEKFENTFQTINHKNKKPKIK